MDLVEQQNKQIDFIVTNNFWAVKDLSVLELGPQSGDFFTKKLLDVASSVACIELDPGANAALDQQPFRNKIKLVQDDFHDAVKTVGQFDAVVIYGILYHSPAPLKLIEDIVNFVKPKIILLETQHEDYFISLADETDNVSGMRQHQLKSCGISLIVGMDIYKKALSNLGYSELQRCQVPVDNDADSFKSGWIYSIFKLTQ
jgi:SAM-dependent methyltransferase